MADSSIVQQWLAKADKDLSIAKGDINDAQRAEYVAFFCQQASEKYLKAYIIANDLRFSRTHDLVNLLAECAKKEKDFATLKRDAQELTPFYFESRYPEFIGVISRQHAKIAMAAAEKIAKFIKEKIK